MRRCRVSAFGHLDSLDALDVEIESYFVYFQTCLVHLVGERPIPILRWLYFVPGVVVAGVADVDRLWVVANIAVAVVAIPNLVAMLCLDGVFTTLMRDEISGETAYATAKVGDGEALLQGAGATIPGRL